MKTSRAQVCCALLAGCSGCGTSEQPAHVADVQGHHGVLGKCCSVCHAPPSPRLHSKAEWPSVISRMDLHRVEARLPALTDSERQQVLAYLQSHAEK